jgi:hypothetical protein
MRYLDGQEIRVGDVVSIDTKYRGTVVGCIDSAQYTEPHSAAQWGHLNSGVVVDTDFGGIVHYPDQAAVEAEGFRLLSRRA